MRQWLDAKGKVPKLAAACCCCPTCGLPFERGSLGYRCPDWGHGGIVGPIELQRRVHAALILEAAEGRWRSGEVIETVLRSQ